MGSQALFPLIDLFCTQKNIPLCILVGQKQIKEWNGVSGINCLSPEKIGVFLALNRFSDFYYSVSKTVYYIPIMRSFMDTYQIREIQRLLLLVFMLRVSALKCRNGSQNIFQVFLSSFNLSDIVLLDQPCRKWSLYGFVFLRAPSIILTSLDRLGSLSPSLKLDRIMLET